MSRPHSAAASRFSRLVQGRFSFLQRFFHLGNFLRHVHATHCSGFLLLLHALPFVVRRLQPPFYKTSLRFQFASFVDVSIQVGAFRIKALLAGKQLLTERVQRIRLIGFLFGCMRGLLVQTRRFVTELALLLGQTRIFDAGERQFKLTEAVPGLLVALRLPGLPLEAPNLFGYFVRKVSNALEVFPGSRPVFRAFGAAAPCIS